LILGSKRSPGEGNDSPLQYFYCRIPRTEEPGGLQSRGHKELDTTEAMRNTTQDYSHCIVITLNGVKQIKMLNHCAAHLKLTL